MLRATRRALNGLAAGAVWLLLFLLSSCFVLMVMVLALLERRRPAQP